MLEEGPNLLFLEPDGKPVIREAAHVENSRVRRNVTSRQDPAIAYIDPACAADRADIIPRRAIAGIRGIRARIRIHNGVRVVQQSQNRESGKTKQLHQTEQPHASGLGKRTGWENYRALLHLQSLVHIRPRSL